MLAFQAKPSQLFPALTVNCVSVPGALTFSATPNNYYDLVLVLAGNVGLTTARGAVGLGPAVLIGMNPDWMQFALADTTELLHLRLAPHQLRQLVDLPLRELAQEPVALGEVWGGRCAAEWRRVRRGGFLVDHRGWGRRGRLPGARRLPRPQVQAAVLGGAGRG